MDQSYTITYGEKSIKIENEVSPYCTYRFYMDDHVLILDYYCYVRDFEGIYRYKCKCWEVEKKRVAPSEIRTQNILDLFRDDYKLILTYNIDTNYYDEEHKIIGEVDIIEDLEVIIYSDGRIRSICMYTNPETMDQWCRDKTERWW